MLFILQVGVITAYLFNGIAGFALSLIMYLSVWIKKSDSIMYKLITSLIISVPLYNIGILGMDMTHIFSWYIIFLTCIIIYILILQLNGKCKCSLISIISMMLLILLIAINFRLDYNASTGINDFIQFIVMVISMIEIYQLKYLEKNILNRDELLKMKKNIICTVLATSLTVIIQYILYKILNINVGYITVFSGRIIFNLLYKGQSVLSIFLGIGIILGILEIFYNNGKRINIIKNIALISISTLAILMNSSRTGIIVAAIVSVLIILKNMTKNPKNILITVAIFTILCMSWNSIIGILKTNRTDDLLDDNGRFITYKDGINILMTNSKTVFFGNGISPENYNITIPHNFIIETAMKVGIIFAGIAIALIIKLLISINNSNFKYIIWHIFLSSMFVTSFHEMTFIIVFIMISIIASKIEQEEYIRINKSKECLNEFKSINNNTGI